MGIDFTTIFMMWSRVGEDQDVVGCLGMSFEKEIAMGKTTFRTLHLYAGPRLPSLEPA